jgi:hypothetical protein
VSVNEKKWLVMHMHVQLKLDGGGVHALEFALQPEHVLQQVSVQDRLITSRLSEGCETSLLLSPHA